MRQREGRGTKAERCVESPEGKVRPKGIWRMEGEQG